MPVLKIYKSPLMGVWKISEPWREMLGQLQNRDAYEQKLKDVRSDSRKQEWLAARLLLKELAGEEMRIEYQRNGAPLIPDKPYHISISHTKGFAAAILNENAATGIDIEYRSDRAWRLRERFLSEEEIALVDASESPKESATVCWCAKEAAFKAMRESGVDFIEHLHIFPFKYSKNGAFRIQETRTPQKKVSNVNYIVADDYVLTWI